MKNLGQIDKTLRVIIALGLIYLTHFSGVEIGIFSWLAIPVYGYFLLTSLFSFCYIYYPLDLSTYDRSKPRIYKA
ncbi:MAG: DUF2892 domain-containing protein [Hyphomicrobiales bacterium]